MPGITIVPEEHTPMRAVPAWKLPWRRIMDPAFRKMLESAQKRKEEYIAKLADVGAEPNSRDRGAEPSEEPRAPSPLDATAAAGSSAVPVQGEARGRSLTLRVCVNSLHMGSR